MQITSCDPRTLAVAIATPKLAPKPLYYNWLTYAFEQPFDPTKHLKPMAQLEPPPSLMATFVTVDIGEIALERQDVAILVFTVGADGKPLEGVDTGELPYPAAQGIKISFSR